MSNSSATALAGVLAGVFLFFAFETSDAASPSSTEPARDWIQVVDHGVAHTSTVPANAGAEVRLFVREITTRPAGASGRVPPGRSRGAVLLVHGASVPSVPVFDFDFNEYSWGRHLAEAGFDVYILDLTGYGYSPRPEMTNPCNASAGDQENNLIPNPLQTTCESDHPFTLTSTDSEHSEIDTVVEFIRERNEVDRVSLIGYSLGGLRAGTYASLHPNKVEKLITFAACCYSPGGSERPSPIPRAGSPIQIRSHGALVRESWLANATCPQHVEPGAEQAAWSQIMRFDPLGSTWGNPPWNPVATPEGGMMRYPSWQFWGWNLDAAQRLSVPTLVIVGEQDSLFNSNRTLYEDLAAADKVFVGVECATHFATWERQHTVFLDASADWLHNGSIRGTRQGVLTADTHGRYRSE